MSDRRAAKSGVALDNQRTMNAKYKQEDAAVVMKWISDAIHEELDTSGTSDSVMEQLKDGMVLTKLYNAIDPSHKLKLDKKPGAPFIMMERVANFCEKIRGPPLGVKKESTFSTVDLYEGQNMAQVIICLQAVASKCLDIDTEVQGFGPKESKGNKREFTEEQLAQGKAVIGLQMGSNKGASQAGQNFGKARHIVD